MTQEDVYQGLMGLHECREPFTVTFSGRKNGSVNGLYSPRNREITIHDRNFTGTDGRTNEPALMYTALHELAHHIQHTEHGQKGTRCHTKLFHAILDDLAEKAEASGAYRPERDEGIEELAAMANDISRRIAELQRELGKVLNRLSEACTEKGVRVEDIVKRKVRVSLETAKKAIKIAAIGGLPEGITPDIQEAIAGERDPCIRGAMAAAAQSGKSVAQVKRTGSSPPATHGGKGGTGMESLLHEKARLETKIKALQQLLRQVMERINSDGGLRAPCAAERKT